MIIQVDSSVNSSIRPLQNLKNSIPELYNSTITIVLQISDYNLNEFINRVYNTDTFFFNIDQSFPSVPKDYIYFAYNVIKKPLLSDETTSLKQWVSSKTYCRDLLGAILTDLANREILPECKLIVKRIL